MPFDVILSATPEGGIGLDNGIPWKVPSDKKYFARVTTQAREGMTNAVVMGRLTWESIPDRFKPLKDRMNVIISKTMITHPQGAVLWDDFDEAIAYLEGNEKIDKIFVIGGADIYNKAIASPKCETVHLTTIFKLEEDGTTVYNYPCDRFVNLEWKRGADPHYFEIVQEGKENDNFFRIDKWDMKAAREAQETPTNLV